MIIFGKNSDDKGTQFENLSFSLLELLGFTNIVCNDIRGGGAEIDIRAEMKLPSLVDSQSHRVICECKAYGKPANINDWLKFLGKVFSEEKRLQQTVYGYFIALNGVNGNVAGHFDDLQTYVKYVKLVNGENLLELVRRKYSFCDLETVNTTLKRFTKRQVQAIEIAYYDYQVFWVITFEKDVYTILQSDSNPVNQEFIDSNKLDEAIKYELSAMSFVDLKREAEAIRRTILLEKYIICQFIISNQNLSLSQITNSNTEFTDDEIIQAINKLEQKLWISKNEIQEYCLLNNKDNFYTLLIEIYRFLFQNELTENIKDVIKSDYYKLHINQDLIEKIKEIQGDINLSNQDIEQIILLLKFSPSALRWSLEPIETLVNQKAQSDLLGVANMQEKFDLMNRNYFIGGLYSLFQKDFQMPCWHEHFYQACDVRELEVSESLIVKSAKGIEIQGESKLRLGIFPLEEGFVSPAGIPWMLVGLLPDIVQPWETSTNADKSINEIDNHQ